MQGDVNLGDVDMTVAPDDTINLPTGRLLDLLATVVEPKTMDTLRSALSGLPSITPGDLAGTGVNVAYDAQALALRLIMPDALRRPQRVTLANEAELVGTFDEPASFSAYLNARLSLDHVERGRDRGFDEPIVFLDGAARMGDFVLESEGLWQAGAAGRDFKRHGTRLVYDDVDSVLRWTAGDILTSAHGFQGSLPLAGISVQRSYGLLRPLQTIRPTGRQSFTLRRPSTVEVLVNGQVVRRMRLDPGPYDLSDFPTTYGANDVKLIITDDTGNVENLSFNLFFDQDQLEAGLSEFAFYAGIKAPRSLNGVDYTGDWAVSGFYRRGMSDRFTLGVNAQAEAGRSLAGLEAVWASPIGILAGHAAVSRTSEAWGAAGVVTFQRDFPSSQGWGGRLNLTAEFWSNKFTVPGAPSHDVPFKRRLGANYSQNFGDSLYAAVDVQHSQRIDGGPDPLMIRGSFGWRLSRTFNLTGDFFHQRNVSWRGHETGLRLALTVRLGDRSSLQASYDSAYGTSRLSYQRSGGEGVGSYSLGADLEHSSAGVNLNGNLNYTSNRAEFAVTHFSSFGRQFGLPRDARTNLRVATSLAFADGTFALGRPVQDSFAIVTGHKSLGGGEIHVDPAMGSYTASSGPLGPALKPNLSAYSDRIIAIEAPEAPLGVDLGRGSFRVFPPYRSGYRLQVGSDYFITASGRFLNREGEPLSLIAGQATELAEPEREKITVFTNSAGRFALSGLRPGRWRIDMLSEPPLTYFLEISEDAAEIVRTGDLRPAMEEP